MPTFGKTTVGVGWHNEGPNYTLCGSKYTLSEAGTISKLTFWIELFTDAPPHAVQCAIYDAALNKLAETEIISIPNGTPNWFVFNLPTPILLQPGDYWLCWVAQGDIRYRWDAEPTGASAFFVTRGNLYGNPSAVPPITAGFPLTLAGVYLSLMAYNASIYATYSTGVYRTVTFRSSPVTNVAYIQPSGAGSGSTLPVADGASVIVEVPSEVTV